MIVNIDGIDRASGPPLVGVMIHVMRRSEKDLSSAQMSVKTQSCRSRLAGDCGLSGEDLVDCTCAIASKPAPTDLLKSPASVFIHAAD
ncbi:hypothetical protein D3C81_2083460 [compost metagenome]